MSTDRERSDCDCGARNAHGESFRTLDGLPLLCDPECARFSDCTAALPRDTKDAHHCEGCEDVACMEHGCGHDPALQDDLHEQSDSFEVQTTDCHAMLCTNRGHWTRIVSRGLVINACLCVRHVGAAKSATVTLQNEYLDRVLRGWDDGKPAFPALEGEEPT